jgi:hypothetical protein
MVGNNGAPDMPGANGGTQTQGPTDLEDAVDQNLDGMTTDSFMRKASTFRNERARGIGKKGYTPGQTLDELDKLDAQIIDIGTRYEGVNVDKLGFLGKLGYTIHSMLPASLRGSGAVELDVAEQNYLEKREGLKSQIDFIDARLNDESTGTNAMPRGLYALQDHYDGQMRGAAESAVEATEFKQDAYARIQELTEELGRTNRKDKPAREKLRATLGAIKKEYKALRDLAISDTNVYSEAKNDYEAISREIEEIEAKQEGLYTKMQMLDQSYHNQPRLGLSEAQNIMAESAVLEVEADEALGEYQGITDKVNGVEIEKRKVLGAMTGSATAQPSNPLEIPSMATEPNADFTKHAQDQLEEMKRVANYEV